MAIEQQQQQQQRKCVEMGQLPQSGHFQYWPGQMREISHFGGVTDPCIDLFCYDKSTLGQ